MKRSGWLEPALLLLIVVLAAYLRLWRVVETPGWFSDEGTHLEIARHLLNGRTQYLSVTQSTLLFARLPLFEWLLAGTARLFGLGMGTLRGVTAILGTLSVTLLYAMVRDISKDRWLALTAALLLAVFPAAVIYSRFGFSYNLLVPLLLVVMWGLYHYLNGSRIGLVWAAFAIGLALITDLWAISLLPVLLLVIVWRRWQDVWWGLLLALLPLGVFTAVSLLTVPDAYLFDWQFTLSRVRLPLTAQLRNLTINMVTLLSQSGWLAMGVVGIFAIKPARLQKLVWLFLLVPFVIIGRTAALYSLSFYYMIPLLPWLTLGGAALLRYGTFANKSTETAAVDAFSPRRAQRTRRTQSFLWRYFFSVPSASSAVNFFRSAMDARGWSILLLAGLLVGGSSWLLAKQVNGRVETAVDPFLLEADEAQETADFLNAHIQPDDLVIASPTLAWMINGRVADFQLAALADGYETPHIPTDLSAERQLFTANYCKARFVVIDQLWHNWAQFNVLGVPQIMAEVAQWPLVFESGNIQVYERIKP